MRLITAGIGIFWLSAGILRAELQPVWQIGTDDDPLWGTYSPTSELGPENWTFGNSPPGLVTRIPADPLYLGYNPPADSDFYTAGIYPPGFNGLPFQLVVPYAEPDTAFESSLNNIDPTNRLHFILSSDQAGPLAVLRLSFELVGGGTYTYLPVRGRAEGFEQHDILVRLKNSAGSTNLVLQRVTREQRFVVDFTAASVQAVAGPNTIEFVRIGPVPPPNTEAWVRFDYLKLEADSTALLDADGDALPRWWEEANHLSDTNPLDAASDDDRDGLTALQEFNSGIYSSDPNRADTDGDGLDDGKERALGTNPLQADTDGDGLSDAEEVNGAHPSSPLLEDTDGDGALDNFERRVGTDPMNAASKPTVFRGAVGIHFVSQADLDGTIGTNELAGIVPQARWNETVPLHAWVRTNGSRTDIVSPVPGKLVRSDGVVLTNMTLSWKAEASYATFNKATPDAKIMDGYISVGGTNSITLVLSNIPFAKYDLYAIVGGAQGQHGRVRLRTAKKTDRFFEVATTPAENEFVELRAGLTNFQRGNFVRYANLSGKVAKLTVTAWDGASSIGLHGVQIVDRKLDADRSRIADWWEVKYGLEPGSVALAAADSDGDGLTNLQEYKRDTDPWKADTDNDGLSDKQEVTRKTNPLSPDTDGDGLSDGAEVYGTRTSNPKLPDSDKDGVNDLAESQIGTDPGLKTSKAAAAAILPVYRSGKWDWTYDNVQFVWNHNTGGLAPDVWNEDHLAFFKVINTASSDYGSFIMDLKYVEGKLTYFFQSQFGGGLSGPGNPVASIFTQPSQPEDLQKALGFSGYGPTDISDRLRFQLSAKRTSGNSWILTFEIRNLTSNSIVASRSFTNCTAAPTIDNGTAKFKDTTGATNRAAVFVHQGVKMFMSPTPLASLPAFAKAKDSDKDGMPDAWEDTQGLNKLDPSDALANADSDGLNNRDEFLAGTNPNSADSDGDGVADGVEHLTGADATDATSQPSGGSLAVVSRTDAARFLQQVTFGPTLRELDRVQRLGFPAWLDDQITNQPPTLHRPYVDQIYEDLRNGHTDHSYPTDDRFQVLDGDNCTTPFARAAIGAPDQLRQRVAFALSQILVVSRRDPHLGQNPRALTGYYDILVSNAFGNYYDVLREVTLSPVMGTYLSHLGNQQARPEINQYPDENYAREVMQLFSIGLWELETNGLRKLDQAGESVPTYNNRHITEFARVFTGLWYGGRAWGMGGFIEDDYLVPMDLWAEKHDFGVKTLLGGFVVPARASTVDNARRDIEDALRNVFNHPNTGPFIGRQLIQFLVTSNPSTNYVARVAAVFANNGAGVRGDLAAVIRAILLDSEARDASWQAPEFGRLKDPVHRAMALARIEKLSGYTNLVWWTRHLFSDSASQEPLDSINVFNFYRPNYQPQGLLAQHGLVAPAFQILDGFTAIAFPNKLWEVAEQGLVLPDYSNFPPDYSGLLPLASDAPALTDRVNLLFCAGSMTATTRDIIISAISQLPASEPLARVRVAAYLAVTCPEGAIQR